MVQALDARESGAAARIGARVARVDQLGLAHGQLPQQAADAMPERTQPTEQRRLVIRQPQQVFGHAQALAGAIGVGIDHAQNGARRQAVPGS